mmetsp:Transcript_1311/g.4931  ORF Transcript_1311/g.4931 Transcript_1311/m.4931 type:complete len:269 (+) Transcript_1311:538-1344(+)
MRRRRPRLRLPPGQQHGPRRRRRVLPVLRPRLRESSPRARHDVLDSLLLLEPLPRGDGAVLVPALAAGTLAEKALEQTQALLGGGAGVGLRLRHDVHANLNLTRRIGDEAEARVHGFVLCIRRDSRVGNVANLRRSAHELARHAVGDGAASLPRLDHLGAGPDGQGTEVEAAVSLAPVPVPLVVGGNLKVDDGVLGGGRNRVGDARELHREGPMRHRAVAAAPRVPFAVARGRVLDAFTYLRHPGRLAARLPLDPPHVLVVVEDPLAV